MIMRTEYKADLIDGIHALPDSLFTAAGKTKAQILEDNDLMEDLWTHYQKAVEEYDVDPDYAIRDALYETCGIPMDRM